MLGITDLKAEVAKLKMLRGRTSQTTAAEREESRSFARLMPYRDGTIFITKFAGAGHWERHPNGDEIVQIIDGTTTLHVVSDGRSETFNLSGGALVVIPQGAWHRFEFGRGGEFDDCNSPAPGAHQRGRFRSHRNLNSRLRDAAPPCAAQKG